MTKTPVQTRQIAQLLESQLQGIVDVSEELTPTSGTPGPGEFWSTITGRANIKNFAALRPVMGVERIQTQTVIGPLPGESGESGQAVYGAVNDKWNQFRAVGAATGTVNANGQFIGGAVDYYEITFYGTGLNLLCLLESSLRTMTVELDGQGAGSNITPSNINNVLGTENYSTNQVINLVSKETLGWHTVKITSTGASVIIPYGFEVLNESLQITVPAGVAYQGGEKKELVSEDASAYNSVDEGSLHSTRGGRVLVYLDENGEVKKAGTPTYGTTKTLTDTNHEEAGEEVITEHYFREFGASRSDDFSLLIGVASAQNCAFTLDDNVTNAWASSHYNYRTGTGPSGIGHWLTVTFVGTGLDVFHDNNGGGPTNTDVYIDGGTPVNMSSGPSFGIIPIVSGLPYGTHTVKFLYNTGPGLVVNKFVVYGPAKPTLPEKAVELGEYFVMANFVPNTSPGALKLGSGILRKDIGREWIYSGSGSNWVLDFQPTLGTTGVVGGWRARSAAAGGIAQLTFTGTGFDFRTRTSGSGANVQVSIDLHDGSGFQNFTSSHPDAAVAAAAAGAGWYGDGMGFTPATGILDIQGGGDEGSGFYASGLDYGTYTIRFYNSADSLELSALDVVTPIHVPKLNGPHVIQNTLRVGNCSVGDTRKFSSLEIMEPDDSNYVLAQGNDTFNTHTSAEPMEDMFCPIYLDKAAILTIKGWLNIAQTNVNDTVAWYVYVDGVEKESYLFEAGVNSQTIAVPIEHTIPLSKGYHFVQIFFATAGANTHIYAGSLSLSYK